MSGNPAPCKVYYFRHGETDWAKSGQHTGRTDIALNANGAAESRALAPRLAGVTFTHVFVSPRLRARQTCELAGLAATAEVDETLAEWDYGEYEGLRSVEIRAHRPGWEIFRDGCPGGESPEEIVRRVDRAIQRLRALSETSRCSATAISGACSARAGSACRSARRGISRSRPPRSASSAPIPRATRSR